MPQPTEKAAKNARYYERIERNLDDMEKRLGLRRVIRKERPVTEFVNPAATDCNINLLKKALKTKKQQPLQNGGRDFHVSNRINILTINQQNQMNEKSR
jgi:hypothetical protein